MSTRNIFRVQLGFSVLDNDFKRSYRSTDVGPYTLYCTDDSAVGGYKRFVTRTSINQQPEPRDDGIKLRSACIFGFKNAFDFRMWFEADIWNLTECGFKVFEFEVPEENIEYGGRQIQYLPHGAKLVKIHDPIDVVKIAENLPNLNELIDEYFLKR